MRIVRVDIYKLNIPFLTPLKVALGVIEGAKNVAIRIVTDSEIVGWGEASPFPAITGDSQEGSYLMSRRLAVEIVGKDPLAIEDRIREINMITVSEPSIRSAFDMALYDILAKAAKLPLYQLFGGGKRTIRTSLTIGLQDTVEQTVARAENILTLGFEALKLKVGRPGLEDVAHVKAVRELAGPDVQLKIDSNQGWDYPTAVANIRAMTSFNLQYSEQPIAAWDLENLKRLRDKVRIPICADESMFDDKDALKLMAIGAADYLNIKLGKAGGLHTALKINAIAEAAGCKCMVGCFGESRLALSAATHLTMARPNICFHDLDSAFLLKDDPVEGGMSYDKETGGLIQLSDDPGHGAAFDESYLEGRVSVES